MPSKQQQQIHKLVSEHVLKDMPDDIQRLANIARMDVLYGPYATQEDYEDGKPYPGFESATTMIHAWVSDNVPSELWVDLSCDYVATSAAEGEMNEDGEYEEPYTDETFYVDKQEIKRAVFGELGEYV